MGRGAAGDRKPASCASAWRPDPRRDYVEGEAETLPAGTRSYEVELDEQPRRIQLYGHARGGKIVRRAVILALTSGNSGAQWKRQATASSPPLGHGLDCLTLTRLTPLADTRANNVSYSRVVEAMDVIVSSGWDARRLAYAVGAVALLAAAIAVFVSVDAGWWVFLVFATGPDLAFLAGIGQTGTLQHGQMPSRAVPAYNALHRIWDRSRSASSPRPASCRRRCSSARSSGGSTSPSHRALGYGLRTPDGFQRA